MDLNFCITSLARNRSVFEALARDINKEQAQWRPAPEQWSILEVINHLYDEEREDFRARLDLTLNHPDETWPPIDPQGWAIAREYNKRELISSLNNFLEERDKSLAWLKTISTPNWKNIYHHPQGSLSAGDLMAAWLAHDLLHIRQITRLNWEYLTLISAPFKTAYAGKW
jgi:hypothetical protein